MSVVQGVDDGSVYHVRMLWNWYRMPAHEHNILTAQLEEMSRLFPDLQIGDLIEWAPKLNVKAYEALPFEARQIFSSVLTIKRALPTLALVSEQDTDE